ncbi:zinc finger CCCH domain-containing protein [Acrasis kona]|uniref:Zinc finger CCCH domain-containing protein n=1 Tax=Acrasis kona TaxID=1008807 RepID=A0AAW2Z7N1_9EUKA
MSEHGTKICIQNFKRQINGKEAREKLFEVTGVLDGIILFDKPYKRTQLYITFNTKENEQLAYDKIKSGNANWKVFIQEEKNKGKRNREGDDNNNASKKQKSDEPPKTVSQVVTPLAHLTYEEQLKHKETQHLDLIKKNYFAKLQSRDFDFTKNKKTSEDEFDWRGIIPSPVINGYRNNCEFTCAKDDSGKNSVGFLLGSFVEGKTTVSGVDDCLHISQTSKMLVKKMQALIDEAGQDCYNKVDNKGFWRQMKVRENSHQECLVAIQINPYYNKDLVQDKVLCEDMKNLIRKHFDLNKESDGVLCKGLFVQHYGGISNAAPIDSYLEKLCGQDSFVETLGSYKFNVSPYSFFQVNSRGAETLYGIASEWAMQTGSDQKPILLDVCCGTGTIGLFMSSKVEKIFGIDNNESACRDAEQNAKANQVENAQYICGKAEEVLRDLLKKENLNTVEEGRLVAVVDPPRAGLHPNVLKAILNCNSLTCL